MNKRQLLISKKPSQISDNMMAQYFDPKMLNSKFENQVPFVNSERDKKEFHEFKIIEIISADEVRELISFTHPKYNDQQVLLFNKHSDKMLELLSHNRVFLYTKTFGQEENNQSSQRVQWKLLRRLENMNFESLKNKNFLEQVTDDFRYFVDVDKANKQFLIRDMSTEEVIHKIPKYLMNYQKSPEEMYLRFRWVGSEMIKIINTEGLEKLVYTGTDDFE